MKNLRPDFMFVDTHAHLSESQFDSDRSEVIARARAVGVVSIISVSENLADALRNMDLASSFPALRPALGLYPAHLDMEQAEAVMSLIRAEREKIIAIGEVGLDHWIVKEESDRELQQEIFGRFVELAKELDLPLNVHSRSAGRHVVALLLERGAKKVQLHAFDGKASAALPAVEAGCFFSIPPSVVRSRQKQKLVSRLPLSCLLLETDSPVLGPDPQERNEPANIGIALAAVAEIKGISRAELTETVTENTRRLYGPKILDAFKQESLPF